MNILFIYPNVTRVKSPQLGICMIAAVARELGHNCDLYDLTLVAAGEEISTFQKKVDEYKPDILAVSIRSNEFTLVKDLFASIPSEQYIKIFGGPHTTVSPEEVMSIADIAVMGEGEAIFTELLTKITSGQDITHVAGCWVKQQGQLYKNHMQHLIQDLDQLPMPYWQIFDLIHFKESFINKLIKNAKIIGVFEASRGCPYACTYCTNDYVRTLYKEKGKWRREKSPERIIEEVELFRNTFGLDYVYWIDEIMLTGLERLKKFSELYKTKIGIPFIFMERPENMNDEKARIIKEAGAHRVSIGIESGDEDIRRKTLNRHHSQETIINAFHTARKHGLITSAFTMIGFPDEDEQSLIKSFHLIRTAHPDFIQTTIFHPLRGTKLYETVIANGLFDALSPMPNDYYGFSSLNFPQKQKKALKQWQYLLSNSTSKYIFIFYHTRHVPLLFSQLVTIRKVFVKLHKEGLVNTIKLVVTRLTNN